MTGIGEPDRATVSPEGRSLADTIYGVRTHAPVNHTDHRGRVFEIWSHCHDYWTEPFVYSYCFTVRPGMVKGWGVHDHKHDRYTLIAGEVLTVLYDGRPDSPTHGLEQRVMLTAEGIRQLTIPPGVWHVNINVGPSEAFLVNFPTRPYDYAAPDRRTLPIDSTDIPVDVRSLFPTQFR
jgi:dTDP-4-dehydrorhamnose 3,5-epimerase